MDVPPLFTRVDSPVGPLLLVGDGVALQRIAFEGVRKSDRPAATPDPQWRYAPDAFDEPMRQLAAYFDGELRVFDLPLSPRGTAFQQRIWRLLPDIAFGESASYGELAARAGVPTASRAVGAANGRNPLPIVLPCHRVIGADGSLTGFTGGLGVKRALLELESRVCGGSSADGSPHSHASKPSTAR